MQTIRTGILTRLAMAFLCIMALACGSGQQHNDKDDKLPIRLSAIQNPWGWGYEIEVNGKLFIKQEYIPVIAGQKGFASKEQALFVGNKAMEKIKSGHFPTITRTDLIEAGVTEAKDSGYRKK